MEHKKNLLLMVPMLHQGGFERVCVQTARLLAEDFSVTVLIFTDKDIHYDVSGIEIVNIDVPSVKSRAGKILNLIKRICRVRRVKKERKIDLSYSFGSSANYVNVLSRGREKVLTGIRCQTDVENKKEVSLFVKKSDLVLSCSREILRELRRDFACEKSAYLYNPLDVPAIQEKSEEESFHLPFPDLQQAREAGEETALLVSMGRDDTIKGFWHLIKAFYLVRKRIPHAALLILGAGSFDRARELTRQLGIEEQVFFAGAMKNPFPAIAQADLYVLSSNHEGFPNALLEAMVLGKPIVASDCKTGPREILLSEEEYEELIGKQPDGSTVREIKEGSYGILVPDMSAQDDYDGTRITGEDEELAEAICRMFLDREKMAFYADKAGERAQSYLPCKYRRDLVRILNGIVS